MVKRSLHIEANSAELIAALNRDPDNRHCNIHTIGDIVVAYLISGSSIPKEDVIYLEMAGIKVKRKDSK